jgi:aminoglycoside phosphotransferase (APT) family kinase protein
MAHVDSDGLVDTERLARFMDEKGLPGAGEPIGLELISGGSQNEIFLVKRGDEQVVMRRPPRVVPEGRNKIMLREYRVLEALNGTDVPHPYAYAVCEDESVIGATFYLMELVDGWSPMNMGDDWPAPFDTDLEARAGLAFQLVDGIARLSKVDWKARGLEGFGNPEGFHERQVDRWYAHLSGFRFREIPGLDVAAQWLREHKPHSYVPGIIHGDYQFANVMFKHGAPAQLAAIVDWEMATVGDPLLDLAWVMTSWPDDPSEDQEFAYVPMAGMPGRTDLLEYYSNESGRPVDDIDYYIILARFKLAIVLEGGYARFVEDPENNQKVEGYGPSILNLAQQAAELTRTTTLK